MSIATSQTVAPPSGPCAGARTDVDATCSEAERLAQARVAHERRLRDVRQELMEVGALRDADARVRDRRLLSAAKDEARSTYRQAVIKATDRGNIHEAARVWLRDMDRLNRQVMMADRRAEHVARRAAELENALPGMELAADAARIAAEAAHATCMNARRDLAACEEEAQRQIQGRVPPTTSPVPGAPPSNGQPVVLPISLLLRGDRQTLLALALRLAEETGVEAGRLQLLLLELREQVAARALEQMAFRFPDGHPFWGQFAADDAGRVAASLASMGYRFDGRSGWMDSRSPTIRELVISLSHMGLDPRALHRPSDQLGIDALWQGTTVLVEEYLATSAPDLDLDRVIACLGNRSSRLAEVWDMWGRLRPLLLTAPSGPS